MRTGIGYDLHKLTTGRKLIIGGVEIPHTKGLLGHTDADVLIHAVIDALLGATGQGDIGTQFPDSDQKWKDVNSIKLLEIVYKNNIKGKGFKIINIDSTIIAEEPKLKPYVADMKKNISKILELEDANLIGIKSKTNEGMDSTGQKNAIAAWAVVLVS
jgi:2-C-methyl-D-erythritol 2,4-cyclodiphosphate synthase